MTAREPSASGAVCSSCGAKVEAGSKFCDGCGTSKSGLEGERKQVTVLFAGLKGSMELLADRDPEEARKLVDPGLEHMMEAVHRYEGTVNQVMDDGIMALFGAPLRTWARFSRVPSHAIFRSSNPPSLS